MTAQAAESEAPDAPVLSKKLVTHVEDSVGFRLRMQASLEGVPPAYVVNRVLGAGLMTTDELSAATAAKGANGNGTH
jgi:hypothetical protein